MRPKNTAIAYFITPHGYGHAARASGVMTALTRLDSSLRYEIFTLISPWFFNISLAGSFDYHPLLTDIGMAQETALQENLPETLRRLAGFFPFETVQLKELAGRVTALGCRLVVCDIAPLGIAVAREAGLPVVLVENFTWDWIYEGYLQQEAGMAPYITYLRDLFQAADYRIQTEPICDYQPADLTTGPISRSPRTPAAQIRQQLDIPAGAPVIMLTMGGIPWNYDYLARLEGQDDYYFIVPGASETVEQRGRLITLPHHSDFFHPDLINAADAVIGKVGYSTIAEVYQAGIPFGYVARPQFRESYPLVDYVRREMPGLPIAGDAFADGSWLSCLPDLLALPPGQNQKANSAEQVARFIYDLLPASG